MLAMKPFGFGGTDLVQFLLRRYVGNGSVKCMLIRTGNGIWTKIRED